MLQQTLISKGYLYSEFILTPTQLGIPNERPRYYCIAKLQNSDVHRTNLMGLQTILTDASILTTEKDIFVSRTLSDYLDVAYDVIIFI